MVERAIRQAAAPLLLLALLWLGYEMGRLSEYKASLTALAQVTWCK